VIGDGPADSVGAALDAAGDVMSDGTMLLCDVAAAFAAALRRNPDSFVADPALTRAMVPTARFADGGSQGCGDGVADPAWVDRFHVAIEAATSDYLTSPLRRRPTVAELFETLSFVVRPLVGHDIASDSTAELVSIAAMPPDETANELILALPDVAFAVIDGTVRGMGLPRDADAVAQSREAPKFASWTAGEGDDREVDYHAEGGSSWLAVRGESAEGLAAALAAALGGRAVTGLDEAFVGLLTVPRGVGRAPGAATSGNGAVRWRGLREAVAAFGEANRPLVEALVAAGLGDPDWRVRMTAVLAVGRLRLASAAEAAMQAVVPLAGASGLDQEDRRALLALRQAAHDRALRLPPSVPAIDVPVMGDMAMGDMAVAKRRRDHQQRLHALLASTSDAGWDRSAALLAALLGGPAATGGPLPPAWRGWLDDN
jgi:hypothetical protein